jgi:hypothetical protein
MGLGMASGNWNNPYLMVSQKKDGILGQFYNFKELNSQQCK